jgi:hypothetical protein
MPYIGRGSDFGVRSRFIYTATAGQTTFSGNDDAGITLAYTDTLYMDVYQNGVLLVPATDYAASTGTSVVLEQGASVGDTVELLVHDIFSVADAVSAKDGGTFSGTIAAAGYSSSTAGTSNYIAGVNAGNSIQAGGNYNVTVGDEAGTALTTGDDNVLLGYAAGDALTTSSRNVAVGYEALSTATAFNENTAVGYRALKANTDGYSNTSVGVNSLLANTTGNSNTAIGHAAGTANTEGLRNTAVGVESLDANTTGSDNTAIGKSALSANTTANNNVAVGKSALQACTTGHSNTAVGKGAGAAITTGLENTLIGSGAGDALTDADYNVAIGQNALAVDTLGSKSIAIGNGALSAQNNSSGSTDADNVAVGYDAGDQNTTGIRNVYIGSLAGDSGTTANSNVIVGYNSDLAAVDTAQIIVLGAGVTSQAANNFTFGFGSNDSNIAFGATSISAPSDVRLKEDIQDETVGLGFVNDLRPVTFQWKKEKDIPEEMKTHVAGSDTRVMNGKHNHGFIAQEVKAVIDKHEMKDGFDMWSEDPTDGRQRVGEASLMPIMVKALQELSEKNDALEARLAALEAK